jgi:IMP dehydrogenase
MSERLFRVSYGFEDVAIAQKKNICKSRLDVDISSEVIRGVTLKVPMIAANMSTVTNADFCIKLSNLGALGVLHRAMPFEEMCKQTKQIYNQCQWIAVSVGVDKDAYSLAKSLIKRGANIIVIDIAHGYCDAVIELARNIKNNHKKIKVVVGNTTNPEMIKEVHNFVDAIKFGIGQGSVCETRFTAGSTEKQFSAIWNCRKMIKEYPLPIISDGGIKMPSDLTKAIGAGANSVMAGQIFARCPESAGETTETTNGLCKIYAGMASRYVQDAWRGGLKDGTCPEGKRVELSIGETVDKLITRYSGALKSGITYAGGKDIKSFQENVEFIEYK